MKLKTVIWIGVAFVAFGALLGANGDSTPKHPLTGAAAINAASANAGFFNKLERDTQIDSTNFKNNWRRDVTSPLNDAELKLRNLGN